MLASICLQSKESKYDLNNLIKKNNKKDQIHMKLTA